MKNLIMSIDTLLFIQKECKCPSAEVRRFSNSCEPHDTFRNQKVLKSEMKWTWAKIGSMARGELATLLSGSPGWGSSPWCFPPCDLRQVTWFSLILHFPIYTHEKSITDLPNLWWGLELPMPKCLHRPHSPKEELRKDGFPHRVSLTSTRKPSTPHSSQIFLRKRVSSLQIEAFVIKLELFWCSDWEKLLSNLQNSWAFVALNFT